MLQALGGVVLRRTNAVTMLLVMLFSLVGTNVVSAAESSSSSRDTIFWGLCALSTQHSVWTDVQI